MNRSYFSPRIFLAGVILSVMFFLLFINVFKTYTSSVTILVNTKSEVAALQEKQIINNIIELPKTLAFYDRLLKYNQDVVDNSTEKSSIQRKNAWNDIFSVKKVGRNSSLIKISITTGRESDARILAQKTARNLLDTSALYYDIKNDLDLRIVEGPITKKNNAGWYFSLPLSVILGFLLAFFLQYIITKSGGAFAGGRNIFKENNLFNFDFSSIEKKEIKSLDELYTAEQAEAAFVFPEKKETQIFSQKDQEKDAAGFQEIKKLTKMIEPDRYPNFREISKTAQPKSSAPENLPIADNSFMVENFGAKNEASVTVEKQPKSEPQNHEPTSEQLKERLNKLLRGEM